MNREEFIEMTRRELNHIAEVIDSYGVWDAKITISYTEGDEKTIIKFKPDTVHNSRAGPHIEAVLDKIVLSEVIKC